MAIDPVARSQHAEVLVVGGGIAGISAALALSKRHFVTVLDSGDAHAGSRVAAGLAHTMPAQRATVAWRAEEALAALNRLIEEAAAEASAYRTGVIRPASSPAQASAFIEAAGNAPQLADWIPAAQSSERWPHVKAEFGALWLSKGLAVDITAMLSAALLTLKSAGGRVQRLTRVIAIEESDRNVRVHTTAGDFSAEHLLLACGRSFGAFPEVLAQFRLHCIKGVVLRGCLPSTVADGSPSIAGNAYIAVVGRDVSLGSTYTHAPFEPAVLDTEVASIRSRCEQLMPALGDISAAPTWGVRVTRPGKRLPILTPVSRRGRVWFFGALGSRGLMTAPLIAQNLPNWLCAPEKVWPDLRPDRVV